MKPTRKKTTKKPGVPAPPTMTQAEWDARYAAQAKNELARNIFTRGAASILFNVDRFDDTEKVETETKAKFAKLAKFSKLAAEAFYPQ